MKRLASGLLVVLSSATAFAAPATPNDAGIARDGGTARDGGSARDASADARIGDASTADGDVGDAGIPTPPPAPEPLPEPPPGHEPLIASERTPSGDVHVGDLVTWTIRATVPEGDDVQMPRQTFRALEIRRRRLVPEGVVNGKRTFVITIELVAFEAGDHVVGPVSLRVVTEDGQLGHTEVAGIRVRVRSLLGNEPNAEPKPATRPVGLVEEDPTLKYLGAALLAMLLGGLVALFIRRMWQRRPKVLPPPPPPEPPWRIALARLEILSRDRVTRMEAGETEAWVDELSDTIRAYLGARFGFDGLDMTTDEIVAVLRDVHLGTLSWQEVTTFLGECDLAKFAALMPSDDQMLALLETATRIVRLTTHDARPTSVMVSAPPPNSGGAS